MARLHPLVLVVVVAAVAACKPKPGAPGPVSVRTVTAQPRAATPQENGPAFLGVIRGDTETSLSFKVNGQIVRIGPDDGAEDWKEGTAVAADAVLAQLDTSNFVNTVTAARARAELARAAFSRTSDLLATKGISQSEFDSSRAQRETAEADLAQAEQNLRDATLRSPYAGIVLNRAARAGEYAGAGRPVLRLGDFRRVSLEVGVPDTLLARIGLGQVYAVRVAAFEGEDFSGTISEIGTAAAEGSRLFRVVLKLDNAAGRLKSGMTATVRLGNSGAPVVAGMLVPLSALVATPRAGDGAAVWVVGADRHVRERIVKTADIVGSAVVVTEGLAAGEEVVTLGAGQLYDGAAVDARPANR